MRTRAERIGAFAAGVVSFTVLQVYLVVFWESKFLHRGVKQAWFLNSGRAIVETFLWLLCTGIVFGLATASFRQGWLPSGLWMSAGVAIALCVTLAVLGPGNLWPLVVAMGLAATTPAVLAGVGAGRACRLMVWRRHEA